MNTNACLRSWLVVGSCLTSTACQPTASDDPYRPDQLATDSKDPSAGNVDSDDPLLPIAPNTKAPASNGAASPVDEDAGSGLPNQADAGHASTAAGDLRCQADPALPQRTDYGVPGPYAVGTLEVTFEDDSRPIKETDAHPAAPSRTLVTTIYYPASSSFALFNPPSLADGGPFPMLMYSHGYSSSRDEGADLANRAASHGYIVVAPDFPLTNLLANGGAPDVEDAPNQPGDVSFLIDQLLALSNDPNQLLANAVDASRIGAVGVSLGGLTTLLATFHPTLHDPRIKVSMPIAALSSFFAEGFYHTREVPTLWVHGDLDAFVNYETNARRAFKRAAPNARLLTVARGSHAAFAMPLDPTLVPLLNALIGSPGADPNNPDGVGCGAVGGTLNGAGDGFLSALGGPENFISADEADPGPCRGDEYTHPALGIVEQKEIGARSAVAFFQAYFASTAEARQDGCRYLLHEVTKGPAVTLE